MEQLKVVIEDIDFRKGLPTYIKKFKILCEDNFDDEELEARIDLSTQAILVFVGDELVSFGLVTPHTTGDYLKLELLCGTYKTTGKYPLKGSKVVVDQAIQLARQYKKNAVRLEALNEDLLQKVYRPMGFKDIPGQRLYAELRPLSGGRKTRRRKTKRRSRK